MEEVSTSLSIDEMKQIEGEIMEKAHKLFDAKDADGFARLLNDSKPQFAKLTNTRTAKIVRLCIEYLIQIPGVNEEREQTVNEWIEWSKDEKRAFLRLRIELCLAQLYYQMEEFQKMRTLLMKLLKEVKRLDDKRLLVEIHILESQCFIRLRDLPRARASVTSARMEANVVYIPPLMQARLDYMSGMLYSQEKDFKTAYSYFYESFEAYDGLNNKEQAISALKMLVLSKVMQNKPEDVTTLFTGKLTLKYNTPEIIAIRAISSSLDHRNLDEFQAALNTYPKELKEDYGVASHLEQLSDTLFEQHLSRIIEPYSVVEIAYVAQLINMKVEVVEAKLAQMILDKKLSATLNQDTQCLTLTEEPAKSNLFSTSTELMEGMRKILDSLAQKASLIK